MEMKTAEKSDGELDVPIRHKRSKVTPDLDSDSDRESESVDVECAGGKSRPEDHIVEFGKHRGKTLGQIYAKDNLYFRYLRGISPEYDPETDMVEIINGEDWLLSDILEKSAQYKHDAQMYYLYDENGNVLEGGEPSGMACDEWWQSFNECQDKSGKFRMAFMGHRGHKPFEFRSRALLFGFYGDTLKAAREFCQERNLCVNCQKPLGADSMTTQQIAQLKPGDMRHLLHESCLNELKNSE